MSLMHAIRAFAKQIVFHFPSTADYWCMRRLAGAQHTLKVGEEEVSLYMPKRCILPLASGQGVGMDIDQRYEYAFAGKFVELIDSNTVLLDVGAGHGIYAILAAQEVSSRDGGRVICFEPDPVSRWFLERNNGTFCEARLQIDPRKIAAHSDRSSTTIDDYCSKHSIHPTLIKMDIEGFEYNAIPGMKHICQATRPTILMEFHARIMRDVLHVDSNRILSMLSDWGYVLRYNGHHGYLSTHDLKPDTEWHSSPSNDVNFALWALPRELTEEGPA